MPKSNSPYFLFFIFITFCASHVNAQFTSQNADSARKEMRLWKEEYKLPSLSVAIAIGNEIVFAEAVGYRDLENFQEASAATQYSVGSIAKPMTGIALAKLVDMGKVDLDSPVSGYVDVPSYTRSFTVRQLASHLAGVPHDTPERKFAEFVNLENYESPFEAFHVFSSHPLLFEPGSDFAYSSNGYILLSAVVEKAAGMKYTDFLESMIWEEFGMASTELDTSVAGKSREATYYRDVTPTSGHIPSEGKRARSFLFGGGGFISTPRDLVRMARATYREDYLSAESRQELLTPTRLDNGEINSDQYSIGWRVGAIKLTDDGEKKFAVLHHGGVMDKAATSFLLVVPDCEASIAFATNYVPEKFWKMRSRSAELLKMYINPGDCD